MVHCSGYRMRELQRNYLSDGVSHGVHLEHINSGDYPGDIRTTNCLIR